MHYTSIKVLKWSEWFLKELKHKHIHVSIINVLKNDSTFKDSEIACVSICQFTKNIYTVHLSNGTPRTFFLPPNFCCFLSIFFLNDKSINQHKYKGNIPLPQLANSSDLR